MNGMRHNVRPRLWEKEFLQKQVGRELMRQVLGKMRMHTTGVVEMYKGIRSRTWGSETRSWWH